MGNRWLIVFVVALLLVGSLTGPWLGSDPAGSEVSGPEDGGGVAPREAPDSVDVSDVTTALALAGNHFTENRGQVDNGRVRFYSTGAALSVGLTPTGVLFDLQDDTTGTAVAFRLTFEGCNRVEPIGVAPLGHPSHFFVGADARSWITDVRNFAEVVYEDLWDGVDARFYFLDGTFKYEFALDAGVDPGLIVMRYEGIDNLEVDPGTGDLLVRTVAGTVRDARPVVLQDGSGASDGVAGTFTLLGGNIVGFEVPNTCSRDLPLVIDPGIFLGGLSFDHTPLIALDGDGDVYVVGNTGSADFPTTPGAYSQQHKNPSSLDVFILKLDIATWDIEFSTFYGGTDIDQARSMALADDGSIIVMGSTFSGDLPTAGNPMHDSNISSRDIFLIRLDGDGSSLLYGSYLGGNGIDEPRSMAMDGDGNVYICGDTTSTDLPVSAGAYQRTYAGYGSTLRAAFIMKVASSLRAIPLCTYIDGDGEDYANDLHLLASGEIYLGGMTTSTDIPTHTSAHRQNKPGLEEDCLILQLDATFSSVPYATYMGSNDKDTVEDIEVMSDGSVVLTGSTDSTTFETTFDAAQRFSLAGTDAFLTVLSATLSTQEYGTYIGGDGDDEGRSLVLDPDGHVAYVSGATTSSDLPWTTGAFDTVNRGQEDAFLAGVNTTSGAMTYCTYVGGAYDDDVGWRSLAMDANGDLLAVGTTESADFPLTVGEFHSPSPFGESDVYVFRVQPGSCPLPPVPTGLVASIDIDYVRLDWDHMEPDHSRPIRYIIYKGLSQTEMSPHDEAVWLNTTYWDDDIEDWVLYHYKISAVNSMGEGPASTITTAVLRGPPDPPTDLNVTSGDGAVHLTWQPPDIAKGFAKIYSVWRGPNRFEMEKTASGVGGTSYDDAEVEMGEFYYYAVSTVIEGTVGPQGEPERIRALDVPNAPTSFGVTPRDGNVRLTWSLPPRDGGSMILGYRVWRKAPGETEMQVIAKPTVTQLDHVDSNVTNGAWYTYYVNAYSEVGESPPTQALDASPYGQPSAPLRLVATASDGQVALAWDPPRTDGGRPITRYVVYCGESAGALEPLAPIGNITTYTHTGRTNGVTIHYEVAAVNEAGEGPASETVQARPMGPPSAPTDLTADAVDGGVMLRWQPPASRGGAATITLRILRGTSEDDLATLVELNEVTEYLDADVVTGVTYHYRILAFHTLLEGPLTDIVTVTAMALPGVVRDIIATGGNGVVELTWSAPEDDGGAAITAYVVLRGIFETGLEEVGRAQGALNYTDATVENGREYYYRLYPVNAIGSGPLTVVLTATPLGPPGSPGLLKAKAEGDAIVLTWTAPTASGQAAVTGYVVYRGTSSANLEALAELGDVLTYKDVDVTGGSTYYYAVAPNSTSGVGDMAEIASAKVAEDDGPGLGAAAACLAIGTVLVLKSGKRRWG